jgi:cortactin
LFVNEICISQSAEDWEYREKVEKHGSQRDYSSGFGGKYGVQVDRQDKSAVGWDHVEKLEKHESQKGKTTFTTSLLLLCSYG